MKRSQIAWVFTALAILTVLYWVRLSSRESVAVQGSSSSLNLPSRMDPKNYPAMLDTLSKNLSSWETLHPDDQRVAVAAVLELFRNQQHVKIENPPEFYARRINETLMTNGEIRALPLDRVVMILSVMEYDFDNGKDKDALAQEVLGPKMYEAVSQRRAAKGQG